jgi:hypothetical protein
MPALFTEKIFPANIVKKVAGKEKVKKLSRQKCKMISGLLC